MRRPSVLHIRRLRDALHLMSRTRRWVHGGVETCAANLAQRAPTPLCFTRLVRSLRPPPSGDSASQAAYHPEGSWGHETRGSYVPDDPIGYDDCDPVNVALRNYDSILEGCQDIVSRVQMYVHEEASRVSAGGGGSGSLEYEVVGQYAYFAHQGYQLDTAVDGVGKGSTDHRKDGGNGTQGPFLMRTRLPSCRGLNRKRICDPNLLRLDPATLIKRHMKIVDLGNICDANGQSIVGIRSLRISPGNSTRNVVALIHDSPDIGTNAHYVTVGGGRYPRNRSTGAPVPPLPRVLNSALRAGRVGELHFLPCHPRTSGRLARLFYTVVNEQERAYQLRTCHIALGTGRLTNDRAVYTEADPTKYVSIYKSKDDKLLFVAVVSHGRTSKVFCVKSGQRLKLYNLQLPSETKVLLEHRPPFVFALYNEALGRSVGIKEKILLSERPRRGGPYSQGTGMLAPPVQSVVCRMHTMRLKPVGRQRIGGRYTCGEVEECAPNWTTVERVAGAISTDIDMMRRGLVIYSLTPPSTPRILVLPLLRRYGRSKRWGAVPAQGGLCQVELPITVGSIEPQPNANLMADEVNVPLNAPGTVDVRYTIDLGALLRGSDDATQSCMVAAQPADGMAPPATQESDIRGDLHKMPCKDVDSIRKVPVVCVNAEDFTETSSAVIYVASSDGSCRVPVTLVKTRSLRDPPLGSSSDVLNPFVGSGNKCLVYVYGAYGERLQVNNDLEHNVALRLGYTLCFAHVRGGGELSDQWHSAGCKLQKHAGFHDLVQVLEFLIARNIAQRNRIAVATTSAGGILAGCLYNMRPDLCNCVVLKLPFLDISSALVDPSQPLSQLEHEEFGAPDDVNMDYVHSYSPCDNMRSDGWAKPALVIQCNTEDARAPWRHTAAFVRLNGHKRRNRIFLKLSPGGHSDGSSYEERFQLIAERLSIVETQLR